MSETNAALQEKNVDLANNCQERGKKYSELRKMYETLKRRALLSQQKSMTADATERALHSLTSNVDPEQGYGNANSFANATVSVSQPATSRSAYATRGQGTPEQRTHYQRVGSGSLNARSVADMPPPQRPAYRLGICKYTHRPLVVVTVLSLLAPLNTRQQHRTPLPGAVHDAADRQPQMSAKDTGITYHHDFPAPRLESRQLPRTVHSRRTTSNGYGGITAGMKVGGADARVSPLKSQSSKS